RNNYVVTTFPSGKEAVNWLKKNEVDIVLCDFKMDDMTGAEVLVEVKQLYPHVPVVIITGYSDVKEAVEVMKKGAFDYITKPLLPDEILVTINNALAADSTMVAPAFQEPTPSSTPNKTTKSPKENKKHTSKYIFGKTPEFANIMKQIELVAPTNFSIIIYGESGSGKEAIAQQI